jgi:catechol 2,3-dioxygenase-like lactoylglutathione lyase family enzyme
MKGDPMKYTSTVISVSDINVSRRFYEDLFGLELYQDYGINVSFTCGLSLQQEFDWLIGVPKETVLKRSHNMELAFETRDFDSFLEKLKQYPDIEYLGEVIEHGWGQRVVRFYDPDGHIIEVGENMKMVVERFLSAGMTMEEVSARMDVSIKDLTTLLDE